MSVSSSLIFFQSVIPLLVTLLAIFQLPLLCHLPLLLLRAAAVCYKFWQNHAFQEMYWDSNKPKIVNWYYINKINGNSISDVAMTESLKLFLLQVQIGKKQPFVCIITVLAKIRSDSAKSEQKQIGRVISVLRHN